MRVISDTNHVRQRIGWEPVQNLLAPQIRLDEPKMVTPIVAEMEDGDRLLVRHQEMGNLQALDISPPNVTFFDEYVTLDSGGSDTLVHESLGTALAQFSNGSTVRIGGDLPYARYAELQKEVDLAVDLDYEPDRQVHVTRVSTDIVRERIAEYRRVGRMAAQHVIQQRAELSDLGPLLEEGEDTRFVLLDAMLSTNQADAVLAACPVNTRELTGLTSAGEWFVLRLPGDGGVYIITSQATAIPGGKVVGAFENLAKAVIGISSGIRIGIEDKYLSVGLVTQLLEAGIEVLPASKTLSKWREYRDIEDIPSIIVAAEASRYSIEGALEFAEDELKDKNEVCEMEVFSRYIEMVRHFQDSLSVPRVSVDLFFTNCHAGDRTIFPALPSEHLVTSRSQSLKFDAGLKVAVDGVVLGTSDLARTLATTNEVKSSYEILSRIVRDQIEQSLTIGQHCENVHSQCIEAVLDKRSSLVDLGMLPPDIDFRARYNKRNVGHLMGKQESFVTEFRPRDEDTLQEGAIGALELQWSCNRISIAAEEMWVLTSQGSRILTA